jgi:hypothetical protein
VDSARILLENGADPNVKETANGQSALMFAAAADRLDVVKLLMARGADLAATSRVEDFASLTMTNDAGPERRAAPAGAAAAGRQGHPRRDPSVQLQRADRQARRPRGAAFRARQGAMATAEALIKGGANINQRGAGDKTHADTLCQ